MKEVTLCHEKTCQSHVNTSRIILACFRVLAKTNSEIGKHKIFKIQNARRIISLKYDKAFYNF